MTAPDNSERRAWLAAALVITLAYGPLTTILYQISWPYAPDTWRNVIDWANWFRLCEFIFGLAHGLGWIAMSIACLYAARRRIISLRIAVAVVVIGGIGPFVGSYEFVRAQRELAAR